MAVISKLKGILFGRYLWVTNTLSGGKIWKQHFNLIHFFCYTDYNVNDITEMLGKKESLCNWCRIFFYSGLLLSAGDLIQQTIEHSKKGGHKKTNAEPYDWKRSGDTIVSYKECLCEIFVTNPNLSLCV
jgi:hypothetical protein